MRRSTKELLTTHTGSLPRPAKVVEQLLAEKKGDADRTALDPAVREAVADVIAKQQAAGIDIVNDGEQGRTDYTVHVIDRLNGFEGTVRRRRAAPASRNFPSSRNCSASSPRRSSIARPARARWRGRISPRPRPTSPAPRPP